MVAVRSPRLAPFALAAVSVTAALNLARVYRGGFLVPIVLAATIPHLLGALLRRRPLAVLLEAVVPIVALGLFLIWATPDNHTVLGLPTGDSFRALSQALSHGARELSSAVVPVAAHGGILLLGLAATWLVAQLADALAFRAQVAFGAVVPSLALFVVGGMLGTDRYRAVLTAAYGIAVVGYLITVSVGVGIDRRAPFGRSLVDPTRRLGAVGVGLGCVAVAVGVLVAPAIPGATAAGVLDVNGLGGPKGPSDVSLYSPVVDVTAQLRDLPETTMFRVATVDSTPRYWRIAALRTFDGTKWQPDGTTVPADRRLDDDELSGYERRTLAESSTTRVAQHYTFTGLVTKYLPAAFRPVSFRSDSPALADTRVIVETDTLISQSDVQPGDSYDVVSAAPVPLTAARQQALAATGAERAPVGFVDTYTQLPPGVTPRVAALAHSIVEQAGARTPFEQASAIQEYFRSPDNGFVYDLRPRLADQESASAMDAFLFSDDEEIRGHGYCVQFATAFTELTRSLGIPTRFAVGFTSGDRQGTTWTVRGKNAHTWPEVWIPSAGWLPFEPTPGPADAPFVNPDNPSNPPGVAVPPTAAPPTSIPSTVTTLVPPSSTPGTQPGATTRASGARWSLSQLLLVAVPVAVGLGVGAVLALVVLRKRRRRSRRRHGTARAVTLGAWDEALDRLAEAGIRAPSVLTPNEFAVRIGDAALRPPLQDLARRTTAAQWSFSEPPAPAADAAWDDVEAIEATLRGEASRWTRLRRMLHSGHRAEVRGSPGSPAAPPQDDVAPDDGTPDAASEDPVGAARS